MGFWGETLRAEMAPYPGRMAGTLRTTLACAIAVSWMLGLHVQAVAPGLYMLLLVSYEEPFLTLRTGIEGLAVQTLGVIAALALVEATGNAPAAHVLGVAAFTFLSTFVARATGRAVLAIPFGIFSINTLASFEMHLSPERLIEQSVWPVVSGGVAMICAVAVEYMFHVRDPLVHLNREIDSRLAATEEVLRLCERGASAAEMRMARHVATRLAFAGQNKMQALAAEAMARGADDTLPLRIPIYAHLADLAAVLAAGQTTDEPGDNVRYGRAAAVCRALRQGEHMAEPEAEDEDKEPVRLLDQMEATLAQLREAPAACETQEEAPGGRAPFFPAGAFEDAGHLYYSLRVSLCATVCYLVYSALSWPGIQTSVLTVLITALGTTGAIKQKQAFRAVGSTIGGVVLGIGSMVFLFPQMDSLSPVVLLVSAVVGLGAWISRGPHFSYVGMQIVFSFLLVTLPGYSTPVGLVPARDRLAGIALAIAVMWLVFDCLYPERTTAAMQQVLARLVRSAAGLLRSGEDRADDRRRAHRLRVRIAAAASEMGTLAELAPYEFGTGRERHMRLAEGFTQVSLAASGLALSAFVLRHDGQFTEAPEVPALAAELEWAASAIEKGDAAQLAAWTSAEPAPAAAGRREHVRMVVHHYGELRTALRAASRAM